MTVREVWPLAVGGGGGANMSERCGDYQRGVAAIRGVKRLSGHGSLITMQAYSTLFMFFP